MPKVDVAILGGGLAGNLLALQLRKHSPNVSVALFEKSPTRGYKVGESTVEVATNYLIRRMGLSTYVYKEHLPKNGLRFFFDTEGKDSELTAMSEIGVDALPPYPSFQLDRARLERDLLVMNREAGVDIHLPAAVSDLELASDGGLHRFVATDLSESGQRSEWQARWVIDTTGRPGMVAKARDLRVPEPRHQIAASWARMTGVLDMDALNAPAWQKRARWTSRMLSTNHFMYEGYWIWFIPLREGITSVGIVCDKSQWDRGMAREDGFREFIGRHKAPGQMIQNAEMIDIGAYNQLAFRTKRFFSGSERWACVGDSAAFTDPFYSPGSDFIALENDFVADLIHRDFGGQEEGDAIATRADLYDAFIKYRYDTTMAIYDGLYETFGCYELFLSKIFFDTALYYNLIFDAYACDLHLDEKWLRGELRRKEWGLQTMLNFRGLFRRAAKELKDRGQYYRGNQERYALDGRSTFGVLEPVGDKRKRRQVNARSEEVFEQTQTMLRALFDGKAEFLDELLQGDRDLFDAWSQLEGPASDTTSGSPAE